MATIQLHTMFQGLSGRSGGWVYKQRNGKVYLSKCPDFSKRKLSGGGAGNLNIERGSKSPGEKKIEHR
ncbi:hypothetical protein FBQ87_11755 [Sphingobacteriales bacterium CHB3]|nr:hypothetical protein [Sphingobacteriales bacterium CHB3]